jgi:alpha-galactosidase
LFIGAILMVWFSALTAMAGTLLPPGQNGSLLEVTNGDVRLEYNLSTGRANFYWQNSMKISGFYAGVELGSYITDTIYTNHTWTTASNEVVVTSTTSNLPPITQTFVFDQNDSFLASVSMSASTNLQSNWMGPVIVDSSGFVNIGITNDNRALFVPYDNDDFVSYNSEPMNGSDEGNEVAAFYDNVSRNGLVVGSVKHDIWKTGVYWSGSNNKLSQMNVFGGVTNFWTWDVMPHGSVIGNTISSPTIFVGFNDDWRTEMENFANENALFAPKLAWTNGVPFGWNSWGVTNYQVNISYNSAIAVSDSIHTNLEAFGFTNNGTAYVNLDSYWSNLSSSQLQAFVAHCHANGQKAGVYWTPFVYWGTIAQATNQSVPGSSYYYSQILLRTSSGGGISYDGGYAIDPTHPGTRQLIQYQIGQFTGYGFDYVKLDFLSHGSLEGVHYDPAITTGIEAFNEGMKYLLSQINGTMFISESIAPIFPYQYGNSRRIACDAYTSFISNTEYTMNSVSGGWWMSGRLYQYNDPDDLVFDNGPTTNEAQSRLINGAVTGLFLNGSILTNAASIALAQQCLTNVAINTVARVGQTFRPVDGATGTGAGNVFVRQDGDTWCIAVFNYTSSATNETVNLSSAGLPAYTFAATNLWNGTTSLVSSTMSVSLNAKQAKLFRLGLTGNPARPQVAMTTQTNRNQVVFSVSSGIPGWPCYLIASTNAALPTTQWQVVGTNTFDSNGNAGFTNVIGTVPWQFYLLKL